MKIEQYTITSPSFTGSVNIISIPIHSTTTTNQPKIKNVYKSSKNKQTKNEKTKHYIQEQNKNCWGREKNK